MINKIDITNPMGEKLEIDLKRPEKSGLYIKSVTGLGPPNANLSFNSNVTVDGSTLSSANVENRNIVFDIGFYNWATPSIEEIRNLTYRFFPIKREIKMVFYTDLYPYGMSILGSVEKNEPDIFSNDEGCQISIICTNPYFESVNKSGEKVILEHSSETIITPVFSFPFPNAYEPLYSSDVNAHVFSYIGIEEPENTYRFSLFNLGTLECGMTVKMYISSRWNSPLHFAVDGLSDSFRLFPTFFSKVDPSLVNEFLPGDEITLCTIPGKLSVSLRRKGKNYNIMNSVSYLVVGLNPWPLLNPGQNQMIFIGWAHVSRLEIIMDRKYEGV